MQVMKPRSNEGGDHAKSNEESPEGLDVSQDGP